MRSEDNIDTITANLAEHQKQGTPITFDKINEAVDRLYGGWNDFPEDSKPFTESAESKT